MAPPKAPTDLSNEDLGFGRISSEVKRCFLLGLSLTLWGRITPEQFCCWSSQELEKSFIHAVMHSFLAYLSYFSLLGFIFAEPIPAISQSAGFVLAQAAWTFTGP